MYKADSVPSRAKILLQNIEYLRDNKPDFIKQYRFSFPTDTVTEEALARAWRLVQQDYFEIRGMKWLERQKCSSVKRSEYSRSQEKPEELTVAHDLSEMVHSGTLIEVQQESFFQYIIRKLF